MADYATFANAAFDPNDYANAILAGESYQPSQPRSKTTSAAKPAAVELGKEDISVALAKLNYGIDDVAKQLKTVVVTHHEALLTQAAGVTELESSLRSVRRGLDDIGVSLEKLRLKIRVPYQNLSNQVIRLQRLQLASDALRRAARFIVLARRLEFQMAEMEKGSATPAPTQPKPDASSGQTSREDALGPEDEKERTIAKAALSIAELVALLEAPSETEVNASVEPVDDPLAPVSGRISLRSINVISSHMATIEAARVKVTTEMESMVFNGLQTLNQSLLASSLQTAHNLRVLPQLVESLVRDLTEGMEARIRAAFDVTRLSKENAKETPSSSSSVVYKSRVRTEPTTVTAPQWISALWANLETMIEDMTTSCIKVYTLEKVLLLKKDTVTQAPFLDEAMQRLENKPSSIFWTVLARTLEKQCRDAAKGSTFMQQTLSNGYLRFLRLFRDFFAKIAVHTDTVYTQNQQSPETVLVLRAVSNFEALYLSRSANRLNETVGSSLAGGARAPPSAAEGIAIARTVANELDSARFDPLLVRSVARNVVTSLDLFLARVDTLTVKDRLATSLIGPAGNVQQALNAQLVTALYHCWARLSKLEEEYPETVIAILRPVIQNVRSTYEQITDPLLRAMRRELSSIIVRLHRVDFGKGLDAMPLGGPSVYMKELLDKLNFIRTEVLTKFAVPELTREWVISIVRHVLRRFVLHVSITKPLGESGKLQLTTDMTELEFALGTFLSEGTRVGNEPTIKLDTLGDDYRALRALRPLLFLDNARLASIEDTKALPPLVVLHHILVRSPLPLPHTLHGWHEAEYVRWVDEHTDEEVWTLVEGGLARWQSVNDEGSVESQSAKEYVELARTVLLNARAG